MSPSLEALETHFSGSLMAVNIVFIVVYMVTTSMIMTSAGMRMEDMVVMSKAQCMCHHMMSAMTILSGMSVIVTILRCNATQGVGSVPRSFM